ncbi:thiopurine S-methyltransferase [Thalassotalea nanhaiensis]|uniref:Thiopurine S-methyltransferase n=1 Tax=Thalassotalea nanhaiensis TaxID=3065648 RepID=A0ABY9TLZ8_9GAMM|nr:thiopurine S-methyltransferase [Colwelliaceae bacterium SQ345]
MKQQFWHDCWDNTHIGFHQDELQPLLVEYFPDLLEPQDSRIFVPLCGKTSDLLFFADRFKVIGNELSAVACRDFFLENQLTPQVKESLSFNIYQQGNIELYQGDFFALNSKQFQPFDWIYDRAALIAFPEEMRVAYVQHINRFISAQTRVFLLTLEFPKDEIQGPPFSVDEDEVMRLFNGCKITKVTERDLTGQKFARRKLAVSSLTEKLYIISK